MAKRRIRERFAYVPISVMQSEAWRTLPHGARSVLLVLAVQYNGKVNGVQNLARATCRRYGLAHSRALKHAKTLEDRGLVVKTYEAHYTSERDRIPSQWALGWHDITHADNRELGRVRPAENAWLWWPEKFSKRTKRPQSADESAAIDPKNCGRFDTKMPITADDSSNLSRSGDNAATDRRARH